MATELLIFSIVVPLGIGFGLRTALWRTQHRFDERKSFKSHQQHRAHHAYHARSKQRHRDQQHLRRRKRRRMKTGRSRG